MYTRVLLTLSFENNPGLRIKSSAWESIGFKIYRAHNFSEVLDYLALKEIEILILDFDLIAHDPFACIKHIKRANYGVMVAIAADFADFDHLLGCELGIDEVVIKPIQEWQLMDTASSLRERIVEDLGKERSAGSIRSRIHSFVVDWVSNGTFCLQQLYMFESEKFANLFKAGTKSDLKAATAKISRILKDYAHDPDRFMILLNTVLVTLMRAALDSGCEMQDVCRIMEHSCIERQQREEPDSLQEWLMEIVLNINQAILNHKYDYHEYLVYQVKRYIQKNYSKGITLNSVSRHFHVNPSYLSRIFLEHTGENYLSYVNRIRITKAKELLKTSDKKIYEVALEIGFNDTYYFSTWFKRLVGESPSNYRIRAQAHIAAG